MSSRSWDRKFSLAFRFSSFVERVPRHPLRFALAASGVDVYHAVIRSAAPRRRTWCHDWPSVCSTQSVVLRQPFMIVGVNDALDAIVVDRGL